MQVDARAYRRCDACLATFVEPDRLPSPELERREYGLHRNRIDDPGYRAFLDRLGRPLTERLRLGAFGLDYGCGPAPALATMLAEAGFEMAVWDPIYAPDPSRLATTYDFITCTEVVEHFHHPADEFRRLDSLLRPDGVLAVMTMFQTDDARFANWHYRRDPTHVVFYRPQTMQWIADRHGWTVEFPAPNITFFVKSGERR